MFSNASAKGRSSVARLQNGCSVYQLVVSTGQLARFVVVGSFVTAKDDPNDVEIILLMEDAFDLESVTGEDALPFHHAAVSGFLAEIDRMQLEVREYFSFLPAEKAGAA
jgi:hypothetical protein